MAYRIYPLNTGYLFSGEGDGCDDALGPDSTCHVPALSFLVTNSVHHFLVDTGMPDTAETLKHRSSSIQPDGFHVVARLAQLGLSPGQLDAIVLSHLHWDHCAYIRQFGGVRKFIQASEAAFAICPPPDYRLSYRNAQTILDDPDIELIQGHFVLNSEIRLIFTPGHSPGHQSVRIKTVTGPYILAADAVWPGPKGLSPPRKAVNPVAAERSFQELMACRIPLLGSHDPSVLGTGLYGQA